MIHTTKIVENNKIQPTDLGSFGLNSHKRATARRRKITIGNVVYKRRMGGEGR
jgi:hypothetical protein